MQLRNTPARLNRQAAKPIINAESPRSSILKKAPRKLLKKTVADELNDSIAALKISEPSNEEFILLKNTNAKLKNEITLLKKEITSTKLESNQSKKELEIKSVDFNELQKTVEILKAELSKEKQAHNSTKQVLNQRDQDLQNLNSKITESESMDSLKSELSRLKTEVFDFIQTKNDLKDENTWLRRSLLDEQAKTKRKAADLATALDKLAVLQNKTKHDSGNSSASAISEELEQRVLDYEAHSVQVEHKNIKLLKKVEQLKSELADLEAENETFRMRNQLLTNQNNALVKAKNFEKQASFFLN